MWFIKSTLWFRESTMQIQEFFKGKKVILVYIKGYVCKPIEETFEQHPPPLQDKP
jgi:hypothetical protein